MYLNYVNGYRTVAFKYFLYLVVLGGVFFIYINLLKGDHVLVLLDSLFLFGALACLVYLRFVEELRYLQPIIRIFLFLFYGAILFSLLLSPSISITLFAWIFLVPPLSYLLLGRLWGGIYTGVYVFFELTIFIYKFFDGDLLNNFLLLIDMVFVLAIVWVLTNLYEESQKKYQTEQLNLASKDRLTGFLNRSVLKKEYSQCLSYSIEKKSVLTLCFINIDWFKLFKENSSFEEGDELICLVAGIIRSSLRNQDVAFRFGGEEFCLLLPDTNIDEAYVLVDQIRRVAMDRLFNYGGNTLSLTVSAGLAESSNDTMLSDLLRNADQCLYKAKEFGHNQVVRAK